MRKPPDRHNAPPRPPFPPPPPSLPPPPPRQLSASSRRSATSAHRLSRGIPLADALDEFKRPPPDRAHGTPIPSPIGHTGAGGVNLALKSGTNALHGALSFYNRDDSRSASLFASNRLGTSKQPRDYNRFSGTVSGPILRNKTFFMFSYEKLQDDTVEALTTSVPTARMRSGDFSELLPLGVQIYDPATARLVNNIVVRDPFPGNVIPASRINPIARNVLGFYPAPNIASAADLSLNYFIEQPWTYGYNFAMTRIDHEWTPSHRTYGRFLRNFRREERFNFAGQVNGVEITRGSTDRFNYNWAGGHTAVISPSMVLDLKASWLRFNDDLFPLYNLDLASLGYSPSTLGLLGDFEQLPRFSVESGTPTTAGRVATLGAQQSGFNNGRTQPFYNVQFAATLTKTTGGHTMKFGYDWRSLRQKETNLGWRGGAYAFDSAFTRASQTATGQYGQGIAAFLLGLPTNSSFIELRPDYDMEVISHGFFAHDDWRVSDRLTLNLGLRYDLELGMTEADNRNIGPFDLTTSNPIEAAAQARFAANPPAGVPLSASQFRVLGGYTYLSGDQSRAWNADLNNFQPRVGVTYKLDDRMVLRGGGGKFVAPFQLQGVPGLITGINQIGYSRNTPVPVTADNGLTFQANLSNPVPSNQLVQPVGICTRASDQPRECAGQHLGGRSHQPRILEIQRRRRAAASMGNAVRDFLHWPARIESGDPRTAELCASAVPYPEPRPRQRRGGIPDPDRGESISGADARHAGQQRRDHCAPPPALCLPAVRNIRCAVRNRHLHDLLHGDRSRNEHVSRRDFPARQTVHGRLDADDVVHLVSPDGKGCPAQPVGRSRRSHRRNGSAASHHACQRGRAALRPRTAVWRWLECGDGRNPGRVAGQHEVPNGRAARRSYSIRTRTLTHRAAIRAI